MRQRYLHECTTCWGKGSCKCELKCLLELRNGCLCWILSRGRAETSEGCHECGASAIISAPTHTAYSSPSSEVVGQRMGKYKRASLLQMYRACEPGQFPCLHNKGRADSVSMITIGTMTLWQIITILSARGNSSHIKSELPTLLNQEHVLLESIQNGGAIPFYSGCGLLLISNMWWIG